jgi:hypothetical protein
MRFSVHLCQRKFLNKHLRFSIHVSHALFIPPLVSKSYAPRFCHVRTFQVQLHKRLGVAVTITNGPVSKCERGAWGESCYSTVRCTIFNRSCRILRVCIFCENVRGVVYYETIKRKLNRRLIYECRWDEEVNKREFCECDG